MTLANFIKTFDKPNFIVLLEGKREVLDQDRQKLIALGELLGKKTQHITFRSGNAAGSDQLFSDGVTSVDPTRLQVITPYTGHRKKTNSAYATYSLEDVKITNEPEVIYQSKSNKKFIQAINEYVAGNDNLIAKKAAYIIRDTVKVIGTEEIPAAHFGIFYDDLSKPVSGGTGHTMKICIQNNIPLIDQQVWFNWL